MGLEDFIAFLDQLPANFPHLFQFTHKDFLRYKYPMSNHKHHFNNYAFLYRMVICFFDNRDYIENVMEHQMSYHPKRS